MAKVELSAELDHLRSAPEGQRNDTLNICAFKLGQLVAPDLLDARAVTADLKRVAGQIGLAAGEAAATIQSGLQAGQRDPRVLDLTPPRTAPAPPSAAASSDPLAKELASLGETDADNAARLDRRFSDLLICTPGRGFLVFDGARWRKDDRLTRETFAEVTARAIALEAEHLDREGDRARRAQFANQSLSKGALDRMLEVAKPRLMRDDKLLDADPYLLNVENGTIDLRTGTLAPHDPGQLLTRLVPVPFDPDARCSTFKAFIKRALKGDRKLIAYVRKAVGLTLTGVTTEHVFFFVYGPGRSGKSTFVNLIRDMLGDYGTHTPTETLLAKQYDNGIPNDLARLDGPRMVTAIEANWNRQIDEARLKTMTGGDPITARFMRQEFFEFTPQFKLWFVANDPPGVRGTAEAFWSRVRVLPFEVVIPEDEQDDELTAKLKRELPGVLAWAVRGCLAWQRDGLLVPEAVKQATSGWMQKADHVPKFVNEELIPDKGNCLRSMELYARYRVWCGKRGEALLSDKQLKKALEGLDMTHARDRQGSLWQGVKLRLEG